MISDSVKKWLLFIDLSIYRMRIWKWKKSALVPMIAEVDSSLKLIEDIKYSLIHWHSLFVTWKLHPFLYHIFCCFFSSSSSLLSVWNLFSFHWSFISTDHRHSLFFSFSAHFNGPMKIEIGVHTANMGILNELIFTIFQIFRWWNEKQQFFIIFFHFNSRLLTHRYDTCYSFHFIYFYF